MADIFLSYASVSRAKVRPVFEALKARGYSVWWDQLIVRGQNFELEIDKQHRAAKVVVVFWCDTAFTNQNVMGEARGALDDGKYIPILLDTERTLPTMHRATNYLQMNTHDPVVVASQIEELIEAINTFVGDNRAEVEITADRIADADPGRSFGEHESSPREPAANQDPEQADVAAVEPENLAERLSTASSHLSHFLSAKFVSVQAGAFSPQWDIVLQERSAGQNPGQADIHVDAFAMMSACVTVRDWNRASQSGAPIVPIPVADSEAASLPATGVSWNEIDQFLKWLNAHSKIAATGVTVRLPTESEWEYACRAGTETTFSAGELISPNTANYDARDWSSGAKAYRGKFLPVDWFPANAWGFQSMHGNVWEWTSSAGVLAPYANDHELVGQAEQYVIKGGCYDSPLEELASSYREMADADTKSDLIGFRLACS